MARSTRVPTTERPPKSFWFDPRFGIGLVLIVASVVGVGWIVTSADRTVDVWAARRLLTPGDRVDASDLIVRAVRLGEAADRYLVESALPADGLIVSRTVADGELVPRAAVGSASSDEEASVVVAVSSALPRSVREGVTVDLWSAVGVEGGAGEFEPPAVLVTGATVVRVVEDDGLIVDGGATGVEVMVPRSKLAAVLDAITSDDAISLVPATTPLEG
ncbi:MAG: hypothetical protein RI885_599 [Actinomycetota bacterium]|jgi:hypothetical protein